MTPAYGFVKDGDFTYFLYQETCKSCNMIIALSSYSSGNPDIFITKGLRLPSQNDYDMKRSTYDSEVLMLNLNDTSFLKNATSMADYYVIGVFGKKNTTFQLTVGSSDQPVMQLSEGNPISNSQKSFAIIYFQYYHFVSGQDIEISL